MSQINIEPFRPFCQMLAEELGKVLLPALAQISKSAEPDEPKMEAATYLSEKYDVSYATLYRKYKAALFPGKKKGMTLMLVESNVADKYKLRQTLKAA